jgi:hypothetical protein
MLPETDLLNIGYFEPLKETVGSDLTQNQKCWQDHFSGRPIPQEAPRYIHEAAGILKYTNLTKEERDIIDWAERAQTDCTHNENQRLSYCGYC